MFDRLPSPTWADRRLVLMGDAAHPMLQYLAQGACQALEDADVLGQIAAEAESLTDVGARFTAERAPRTAQVQTMARAFGELCHRSGDEAAERDELLRARALDDFTAIDWLYAGSPAPSPTIGM